MNVQRLFGFNNNHRGVEMRHQRRITDVKDYQETKEDILYPNRSNQYKISEKLNRQDNVKVAPKLAQGVLKKMKPFPNLPDSPKKQVKPQNVIKKKSISQQFVCQQQFIQLNLCSFKPLAVPAQTMEKSVCKRRSVSCESLNLTGSSSSYNSGTTPPKNNQKHIEKLLEYVSTISEDSNKITDTTTTEASGLYRMSKRHFRFGTGMSDNSSSEDDDSGAEESDEQEHDILIRSTFNETLEKHEKVIEQCIWQLRFSMQHLPMPSQVVLQSMIDSVSSIFNLEKHIFPKLKEIEGYLKRLQLCVLPFTAELENGPIKTPKICKFGGFSIPKTLIDEYERTSQSYNSSLSELADLVTLNLDQAECIRLALRDITKKVKRQNSEDEMLKSFQNPTSSTSDCLTQDGQVRTCITMDQMNLVLKCIETLNRLETELKMKERETIYIYQNTERYLNSVVACATRAIRIQNYVKTLPFKRARSLQLHQSDKVEDFRAQTSENPNLLFAKSPNAKFYSSDLLQLESQRLIKLLDKQTISLFSLP